jgi:hypothetical protein
MKPGDTIRWADAPDGAMVRSDPKTGLVWHYVKLAGAGTVVGFGPPTAQTYWPCGDPESHYPDWQTWAPPDHPVTIIALNLTGSEDPSTLRTLAEIAP